MSELSSERDDQNWRAPVQEERDLIAAILALDFPERETLRARMSGRRVRSVCVCPCGSLEFEPSSGDGGIPNSWTLEGRVGGRSSAGATFRIYRDENGVWTLEVSHLEKYDVLEPSSVRLFDA